MGQEKIELKVGEWAGEWFVDEVVRFTGERLGSYPDYETESRRYAHGDAYTLYKCPGGYRVWVIEWNDHQPVEARLYPTVHSDSVGDDEVQPVYDVYTEEEARKRHPTLFAALGMPNTRDIDY